MHNPDASALHRQHLGPVRHHCRNRLEDNTLGGVKRGYSQQDPPRPSWSCITACISITWG